MNSPKIQDLNISALMTRDLLKGNATDQSLAPEADPDPDPDPDLSKGLVDLIEKLLTGRYSKMMMSNKKFVDPEKEAYFEMSVSNDKVSLIERSSIRKQEYQIDLKQRKIFFNQEEISPAICQDLAIRFRKYVSVVAHSDKISIAGIKNKEGTIE